MVRRKSDALTAVSRKLVAVAAKKKLFTDKTPKKNVTVSSADLTTSSVDSLSGSPKRKSSPRKSKKKTPKAKKVSNTMVTGARPIKFRRGTRALMEIRRLQKSTAMLIPKLPFARLVREIIMELSPPGQDSFRIQSNALEALQEFTELYITQFLENSMLCAIHARRVTLKPSDMELTRRIRGRQDPING
uniref:Core Histone H2A/H2B/H3 domain-containing protein n=1 Tax=Graphocephala atropunctata TaxID=36148 RepID=A0A1B6KAU8_9HEMI